MLWDRVFPVLLLTPAVILPYVCMSRVEDLPAIFLTPPFAYSHKHFLEGHLFRLLPVSADDILTIGCLTQHFQWTTWMILSPMLVKAGRYGEQRVAALLWTTNTFVISRLGLLMYPPQMNLHFVFPHIGLKFFSQILTTTTMPQDCHGIMNLRMSFQLLLCCKGGSFPFRMRVMRARELWVFFRTVMNCQTIV